MRFDSDLDQQDYDHGPYSDRVERTCAECHRTFFMDASGEYCIQPMCDRCVRALDQRDRERPPARLRTQQKGAA